MAKIDWQMEDVVMPGDMNQIGQEINDNKNDIGNHVNNKSNPHDVTTEQINKLENNAFSEADRLTDYPVGYTLFYVNSSTTAWPILGSDTNRAIVETMKTSDPQIGTQRITVYSNASASTVAIYERAMNSLNEATAWGAWQEIATSSDTEQINNLINNHISNKNNPHNVTPAQIGAETPAGAQAKVDALKKRNILSGKDTRDVNSPPSFYQTGDYAMGLTNEFKRWATIGLPSDAGGTYCTLLTDGRWTGNSGGKVTQIALTDSGKQYTRINVNDTTWGSWRIITPLTAADVGAVPTGRTVNGKALSANINLTSTDVGAVHLTSSRLNSVNLNSYEANGVYALGSGVTNAPSGFSYGTLQVLASSTDRIAQVLYAPGQGKAFIRYKTGTTWGTWDEFGGGSVSTTYQTIGNLSIFADSTSTFNRSQNTMSLTGDGIIKEIRGLNGDDIDTYYEIDTGGVKYISPMIRSANVYRGFGESATASTSSVAGTLAIPFKGGAVIRSMNRNTTSGSKSRGSETTIIYTR